MSGSRMEITKQALTLFIQSLPVESSFALLNFGSEACFEKNGSKDIWQYYEESREQIISRISGFKADYGGTDILKPL